VMCDMTGGSSGGGWIANDAVFANSYLESVNSYSSSAFPGVQFGPYFDVSAYSLYQIADEMSPNPHDFPTPVEHGRTVSLALKRHLVAKGHVGAIDQYVGCTHSARVWIYRKSGTEFRFVKQTLTNSSGDYSVKLRDRTGKYLAYAIPEIVDDFNLCAEVLSAVKAHNH
ncbi:MAG TPA: hypothetical protein VFK89_05535, partial [Actinomycetota bacterium]|nr:hypothetical protein [Actinomycetota bacterium]